MCSDILHSCRLFRGHTSYPEGTWTPHILNSAGISNRSSPAGSTKVDLQAGGAPSFTVIPPSLQKRRRPFKFQGSLSWEIKEKKMNTSGIVLAQLHVLHSLFGSLGHLHSGYISNDALSRYLTNSLRKRSFVSRFEMGLWDGKEIQPPRLMPRINQDIHFLLTEAVIFINRLAKLINRGGHLIKTRLQNRIHFQRWTLKVHLRKYSHGPQKSSHSLLPGLYKLGCYDFFHTSPHPCLLAPSTLSLYLPWRRDLRTVAVAMLALVNQKWWTPKSFL